ncbi:hypothetical protein [Streptomyces sp. NPDC058665]|uniref:hypothetical protein n=1 Tax=Streptomyces sp. NPDC058665 TaxID=3346586 RepID=UPI003662C2B3
MPQQLSHAEAIRHDAGNELEGVPHRHGLFHHLGNVVPLCPNHHTLFDGNYPDICAELAAPAPAPADSKAADAYTALKTGNARLRRDNTTLPNSSNSLSPLSNGSASTTTVCEPHCTKHAPSHRCPGSHADQPTDT